MIDLQQVIERYTPLIDPETIVFLDQAVDKIVAAKRRGGKVFVATGSGPNLHEGVTTLIAELMTKGLVDSVSTSSAVIAHEMAGTLDKVKRLDGRQLGFGSDVLPKGYTFEFSELSPAALARLQTEMELDEALLAHGRELPGNVIIKAAGNMGYPMGLRTERLAREIMSFARAYGLPFETVAGWGADPKTMIGAGARQHKPVLVSIPQLIGGGGVGIAVADSLPIHERCMRLSEMIAEADVIIESAIVLSQEIHDGPFEVYTGHGIWATWDGYPTYSLAGKTLVRIDLDPHLKNAWEFERQSQAVQEAIDQGLPKTKVTGIPFRMEMSGFARLEGSLPVIGDIGIIWPVLACRVAQALGVELDFVSHPQQTPEGKAMREWIVENVQPIDRIALLQATRKFKEEIQMKIIGIIPARYGSTRLEGKPLMDICGKPMIQYVVEAAQKAHLLAGVIVATDDQRIVQVVESFGGKASLTSVDHKTGTDRVAEVAANLDADVVVNIQGDEPLLNPAMIDEVTEPFLRDPALPMCTMCTPILEDEKLNSPHVVKVVFNQDGYALYFSRSLIPYPRKRENFTAYEHLGLYAYRKDFLMKYIKIPQTRLEINESLEQLRVLESGYPLKVVVTAQAYDGLSVDTQEDLEKVREIIANQTNR